MDSLQGGTITNRLRFGIGHDTHRLGEGGPLLLGGVSVPHDRHLIGHSDADVLLHAITDALLGAAALGDIGELFPDTDVVNKGRDSSRDVATLALRKGLPSWLSKSATSIASCSLNVLN